MQVICHPVLPLLLTTSHHETAKIGDESSTEALSELILWKVYPVGPLCKSGGVRELARISSEVPKALTSVAWVPAILPR